MANIQEFFLFLELAVNIGAPACFIGLLVYGYRVYRARSAAAQASLAKPKATYRRRR